MQSRSISDTYRSRASHRQPSRRCLLAMAAGSIPALSAGLKPAPAMANRLTTVGTATWLDGQFNANPQTLDLARFRLDIEKAISPAVDNTWCMAMVNAMAGAIQGSLPALAGPAQRLSALRDFLYRPGFWNAFQPIRYDMAHALDNDPRYGFLDKLLRTRQGNCISMPLLFVAVGHRLALPLTLAQAPQHAFSIYTDAATGKDVPLENTVAAQPISTASLQRAMPMTDQALAHGIYMTKLSHKGCLAMLAMPLLQMALLDKRDRLAIQLADVVLRHVPRSADAMVAKGSAFAIRMKRDFEQMYPNPASMPVNVRAAYKKAHRQNLHWFEQAEALGWRDPDPKAEERYRNRIRQLLTANQKENKP